MEAIANTPTWLCDVILVLNRVLSIAYIVIVSTINHEKKKHGIYILTLFFPIIGLIVFSANHRGYGHDDVRYCPICDKEYPADFTYCSDCNCQLTQMEASKKKTLGIISKIILVISIICMLTSVSITVCSVITSAKSLTSNFSLSTIEEETIAESDMTK